MPQLSHRIAVNAVLSEAARLSHAEREARIRACVAAGRHNPDHLPFCEVPPDQEVRYCRHCWSVIDPYGLTWSWPPKADA